MTTRQTNQQKRDVAMAFAMAAVLAVTLLGAWLLVRAKNASARHGQTLVEQLAQEGLGTWWQGPHVEIWGTFPVGQDEPVAWTVSLRTPGTQDGFSGMTVSGETPENLVWEQWTLNNAASEGTYEAGRLTRTRTGPVLSVTTRIEQRPDGKLLVRQFIDDVSRKVETSAETPENYAPEGTLQLLRELVARTEKNADFQVVINTIGPAGQEPTFIPFQYEYTGQADLNGQAVRVVRSSQVTRDARGDQYATVVDHLIDPQRGELRRERQLIHHTGQVVDGSSERLLDLELALGDPRARAIFTRALEIAKARKLQNFQSLQQAVSEPMERPFQPDGEE